MQTGTSRGMKRLAGGAALAAAAAATVAVAMPATASAAPEVQPPTVVTAADLELGGLDVDADDVDEALKVDVDEWKQELPLIEEWFEFLGEKVPSGIRDEFEALKQRLS